MYASLLFSLVPSTTFKPFRHYIVCFPWRLRKKPFLSLFQNYVTAYLLMSQILLLPNNMFSCPAVSDLNTLLKLINQAEYAHLKEKENEINQINPQKEFNRDRDF